MSLYRRITTTLYRMPEFRRLPTAAKLVFLALLTSPGTLIVPGIFEGDALVLASILAMEVADIELALRQLVDANMVEVDSDHAIIAVAFVEPIRGSGPANESVAKSMTTTLTNVVDCPAKLHHAERLARLWPQWGPHFMAGCSHGAGTVDPPCRHGAGMVETPSTQHTAHSTQQDKDPAAGAAAGSLDGYVPALELVKDRTYQDGNRIPRKTQTKAEAEVKARATVKVKAKTKTDPLPYTVEALLETLATTSGRFVASPLDKGKTINAQRLVRAHTLDQVRLAGEWLRAGGDGWKKQLDARSLRDLPTWVSHATAWDQAGRPGIDARPPTTRGPANGWRKPAQHFAVGGDFTDKL